MMVQLTSRKTPITIMLSSDNSGTLGELSFLLQSNGYKLMSYSAAKKAVNIDSQNTEFGHNIELTKNTTLKSVYVMEIHYSYYYDLLYYAYTNFSATISDLSTGEIIMTASFSGDKPCKAVLSEFVNKMNQIIK